MFFRDFFFGRFYAVDAPDYYLHSFLTFRFEENSFFSPPVSGSFLFIVDPL